LNVRSDLHLPAFRLAAESVRMQAFSNLRVLGSAVGKPSIACGSFRV
jgi:hypothetical protein